MSLRRIAVSAWPGLLVMLAIIARLLPGPRTIDDAFITFRYARNLVAGYGFVYNLGEHVLGTTTPLYTLLLAALGGLSHSADYPHIALLVNALADGLACLLLLRLGKRLSGRRLSGAIAALLWTIAPKSVTFAIGGMETSIFILLLLAGVELYLSGRTTLAALTWAGVLLTRPDGILLIGMLALDGLWRAARARQLLWRETAIFAATLVPWTIFATLYFGSPIPNSIAAKSAAYRLPPLQALSALLQNYSTPFFEHLTLAKLLVGPALPASIIACLAVYLFLAILGGLAACRREPRAWPVALYPAVYFLVFSLFNPLIFRWYHAPPLPFYFLLILTGLTALAEQGQAAAHRLFSRAGGRVLENAIPAANREPQAVLIAAGLCLTALSLAAWTPHPDHGPQRPAPEMAWHKLELLYAEVGRDLAPKITPLTAVAAGDVGALGYYSNARMLDTVGLMSPEAIGYYPLPANQYAASGNAPFIYAIPPDLILDQSPHFVVFPEIYGRHTLLTDERFLAAYALIGKIETNIYASDGLLTFQRSRP